MKKSLWVAIAGALAVSVVAASAQEVLSANTIGYIKKQLPAQGKLITVSVPLFNMTAANNVFSNLSLAAEAPTLSTVSFWDAGQQRWVSGAKGKTWAANVATQIVDPGEFFFLKGPATSTIPTEITIAGEVPDVATLARGEWWDLGWKKRPEKRTRSLPAAAGDPIDQIEAALARPGGQGEPA